MAMAPLLTWGQRWGGHFVAVETLGERRVEAPPLDQMPEPFGGGGLLFDKRAKEAE
jgi:hypothetical protein